MGSPKPDLVGGLPVCKWPTGDGGFVQVGSLSAADWAQGVPELLRMLDRSGLVKDGKRQKFEQMKALVSSGKVLSATEACATFSKMLELQGRPPGESSIVLIGPTKKDPALVSGQFCSAGLFTTVTVADEDGLTKPPSRETVEKALRTAHRRSLG